MSPERDAAAVFWRHKKEWLALSALAGLLAILTAAWFWIPDSRSISVIAAIVSAAVLLLGWAWWLSAGFSFYRDIHANGGTLAQSLRVGLPRLLAELAWAAVIGLLSLARTLGWQPVIIALLVLGLPLGAALAKQGIAGVWRSGYPLRFWPSAIVVLTAMCYLPAHLVHWRPAVAGFAAQTVSLGLRFGLGFLIAVSGWLLLASLLGRLQRESGSAG